MAKPDWGALQHQFLADHAKTGISPRGWCEAQGLNFSSAKRYIKIAGYKTANSQKDTANNTANSQKEKTLKRRCAPKTDNASNKVNPEVSPDAKRAHYNSRPNNKNALKHGGYGRRMLISDAVTEDAKMLTLDDELFWLRAANLTAAENIGRWQAELEIVDSEDAKAFHDLISSAEKAMHRNTARIESLEYTKGSIIKMQIDAAYREMAIEKVELEVNKMRIEINKPTDTDLEDDYRMLEIKPDESVPDEPVL